jgi:hypothetical protein
MEGILCPPLSLFLYVITPYRDATVHLQLRATAAAMTRFDVCVLPFALCGEGGGVGEQISKRNIK